MKFVRRMSPQLGGNIIREKQPLETIMTKSEGCPFTPKRGYVDARTDYLNHFFHDADDEKSCNVPTTSIVASTDVEDPLYFWQLYSLMGHVPVVEIVQEFYDRVFDDSSNPWFRDVFEWAGPKRHHINTQVAYWVDSFGGGRCYHGGNYRLTFHHQHNAREIMNAPGAKRWMFHMAAALNVVKDKNPLFKKDPRIFPCIVDFLEAKMRTYAMDHGWKFDASDFASLREGNVINKKDIDQQQVEQEGIEEINWKKTRA
jgi:truncated hemoglobin YjbI